MYALGTFSAEIGVDIFGGDIASARGGRTDMGSAASKLTDTFRRAATSDQGQKLIHSGNKLVSFLSDTIHGNIIANILSGGAQGAYAYATGSSGKDAIGVAIGEAAPFGEAGVKAFNGDKKGAIISAVGDSVGLAGSMGGVALGTTIGTIICPGFGTAIGFGAGILVGAAADYGAEYLLDHSPATYRAVETCVDTTSAFMRSAYDTVSTGMTSIATNFTSMLTTPVLNARASALNPQG